MGWEVGGRTRRLSVGAALWLRDPDAEEARAGDESKEQTGAADDFEPSSASWHWGIGVATSYQLIDRVFWDCDLNHADGKFAVHGGVTVHF